MLRRAVIVAAVVGPVLTLINQGDALWGAAAFNLHKAVLTFIVPFCVSMVSGLLAARTFGRVFAMHERAWAKDVERLQAQIVELEDRAMEPEWWRGQG